MANQDSETMERLQSLHEMRGPALVSALIEEFGQLHRQISQLQREMAVFREYQAARDRWLAIDNARAAQEPLPRSVAIDASQQLLPRQGFYSLEHNGRGTPFCWTGPSENFSFEVFIDRTQGADLELRALGCLDFERQKDVRLTANGEAVPVTVTQSGAGLILKGQLPASADKTGTNLVFTVPEVMSPPDPADIRKLGISFAALNISALAERAGGGVRARSDETVVTLARASARPAGGEAGDSSLPADAAAS